MPDHDTTTPLPETDLNTSQDIPPTRVSSAIKAEAKTDKNADQTNDGQLTEAASDAILVPDISPLPVTPPVSFQGSGAVSAGQSVPLKVSAADPKAFGASLEDIATGRVGVSFTD